MYEIIKAKQKIFAWFYDEIRLATGEIKVLKEFDEIIKAIVATATVALMVAVRKMLWHFSFLFSYYSVIVLTYPLDIVGAVLSIVKSNALLTFPTLSTTYTVSKSVPLYSNLTVCVASSSVYV